jgi:hypothetical protein
MSPEGEYTNRGTDRENLEGSRRELYQREELSSQLLRGGAAEEECIQKDWQTDMLLGENLEIESERERVRKRERSRKGG